MGYQFDPQGIETRVIHSLVDFNDRTVIEVGAGDGRMTRRFATGAARVLAIEPSEREVGRARTQTPPEMAEKIEFVVADATSFDYPRATFDIAVLSWSL